MKEKRNLKFYDKAADISRSAMIEALRGRQPEDPTMIPGWQARHLAAHLYIRENTFVASLGIALKPLSGHTRKAVEDLAASAKTLEGYHDLVDKFADGPPWYSPFNIHAVKRVVDISELYVHTEDILRAKGVIRTLSPDYEEALWNEIVTKGAFLYRGVDVGIIAVRPGSERHVVRKASESVAIVGEPGEILLHAFGRGRFADVQFQGDDDAIAILNSSQVGF